MRMTAITLAASMALALTGSAWAQGAPGGNGSGGNVTGGSTTNSSASEPGNAPRNGQMQRGGAGGSMERGAGGSMESGSGGSMGAGGGAAGR